MFDGDDEPVLDNGHKEEEIGMGEEKSAKRQSMDDEDSSGGGDTAWTIHVAQMNERGIREEEEAVEHDDVGC